MFTTFNVKIVTINQTYSVKEKKKLSKIGTPNLEWKMMMNNEKPCKAFPPWSPPTATEHPIVSHDPWEIAYWSEMPDKNKLDFTFK